MARNTKKAKLMNDLDEALGFSISKVAGFYANEEAAQSIISIVKGPKKTAKPRKAETLEEASKRISKQFDVISDLAQATIDGAFRALIVSGPAGLGKSFKVEELLKKYDPSGINTTTIKGMVRATGLFKQLWDHRLPGQVLCLDDADSIFFDDTSLNLLKAVCDTQRNSPRRVSYLSESNLTSEKDGSVIDKTFEFEGTIIFITNYDFDDCIDKGTRLSPHMAALKSRGMYVSLGLRNRKDYLVRVAQLAELGLFKGPLKEYKVEVLKFMEENLSDLDEVTARMAVKLTGLRQHSAKNWKELAKLTCFKKEGTA